MSSTQHEKALGWAVANMMDAGWSSDEVRKHLTKRGIEFDLREWVRIVGAALLARTSGGWPMSDRYRELVPGDTAWPAEVVDNLITRHTTLNSPNGWHGPLHHMANRSTGIENLMTEGFITANAPHIRLHLLTPHSRSDASASIAPVAAAYRKWAVAHDEWDPENDEGDAAIEAMC